MTTDKYCRPQWRLRYGTPLGQKATGAFHFEYPQNVELVIIDFMQFVKHIDDKFLTMRDVLRCWLGHIRSLFRHNVKCVVLCFDRGSPATKTIHAHSKRYKDVARFSDDDSPVLACNLDKPLERCGVAGKNWIRLAGNQRLLQREVYPMLWNMLIDPQQFSLKPNHMLVLHGLPSKLQTVTTVHGTAWESSHAYKDIAQKPVPWSLDVGFGGSVSPG